MSQFVLEEFILGNSPAIRRLRMLIAKSAATGLSVLIQGPTGAGKELVAEALHRLSGRRGQLVRTNVCAIPDTMFEATLFGHAKGAFTGAVRETRGLFAEANGGTLFLDEIGTLSALLQAKLLRAIESGEFRPVGATINFRSDCRIIAATNEILDVGGTGAVFRSDLYHRLAGIALRVPSLSERMEDVALLARHFAAHPTACGVPSVGVSDAAIRVLEAQEWGGNIRELKQLVERMAIFAVEGAIRASDVVEVLHERGIPARASTSLRSDTERQQLRGLLAEHEGDIERVAQALGKHPATVYRRMERLGIEPPSRAAYASVSRRGTVADQGAIAGLSLPAVSEQARLPGPPDALRREA